MDHQGHVTLPRGTRVVTRADVALPGGATLKAGSPGRVEAVDHPTYTVATPAGASFETHRDNLAILKRGDAKALERRYENFEALSPQIVLSVVVGSTAWNLSEAGSDEDQRGVFAYTFEQYAGLYSYPDEIRASDGDAYYQEVEKFIRQALRAEINALDVLYSPLVSLETEVGRWLREARDIFPSRLIYRSFGRYAMSQFERVRALMERNTRDRDTLEAMGGLRAQTPFAEAADALGSTALFEHPKAARRDLKRITRSLYDRGFIQSTNVEDAIAFARAGDFTGAIDDEPLRPKNLYNLLRLLEAGATWLETGVPLIAIEEGRDDGLRERLLAVKGGHVALPDILEEARAAAERLERAHAHAVLPEAPDREAAHALLLRCRGAVGRV